MLRLVTIICFLLVDHNALGQLFDSIRLDLKEEPKLVVKYETKNAFVTNELAKMRSVKAGLKFGNRTVFGLGYNWIGNELKRKLIIDQNDRINGPSEYRVILNYISPYVNYTFIQKPYMEISIPVQIGFGWSAYQNMASGNNRNTGFVALYEPGMVVIFRFLKYFGAGGGIGYRLMIANNRSVPENFNAPIYVLKTKVYLGDIYNDLFRK